MSNCHKLRHNEDSTLDHYWDGGFSTGERYILQASGGLGRR
jgi:hypothetical protein